MDKTLSYQGLLDVKGLFRTIMRWFNERGYDMFENKNYEEVYEDGKQITIELFPYKKVSDYHKFEIMVYAELKKLKEVEVEVKGVKHKLMKGEAFFSFDATLLTDYQNRWEGRAFYYFFRSITDKFINKSHMGTNKKQLENDAMELVEEIKSYLNMFRNIV